jgi:menaquinone-dependent protoporphyrinogen IX oxidase
MAASRYGATGKIARAIGDVLAEHGFDTTVIPPEAVGPMEDYDAVILGRGP